MTPTKASSADAKSCAPADGQSSTSAANKRVPILVGKQPASLTWKHPMLPFPVEWSRQRESFGIGAAV